MRIGNRVKGKQCKERASLWRVVGAVIAMTLVGCGGEGGMSNPNKDEANNPDEERAELKQLDIVGGKADFVRWIKQIPGELTIGGMVQGQFTGFDSARALQFNAVENIDYTLYFKGDYEAKRGAVLLVFDAKTGKLVKGAIQRFQNQISLKFTSKTSSPYYMVAYSLTWWATGNFVMGGECAAGQCINKIFEEDRGDYTYLRYRIEQPKYYFRANLGKIEQFVEMLKPKGVADNAPVYYYIGAESDMTENSFVKYLFPLHGKTNEAIYIGIEHRGFGQSLSFDEDQSVPDYVHFDEVTKDAHRVATQLKPFFTGPWMTSGGSYGGAIALEYASRYPDDVKVVASINGVTWWPFALTQFEPYAKTRLGDAVYTKLVDHMKTLKAQVVDRFDQAWQDRAWLLTFAVVITRDSVMTPLLPSFQQMVMGLGTAELVANLKQIDAGKFGGAIGEYVTGFTRVGLTREEALTGKWNWYTYKYLMCTQKGTFFTSNDLDNSIFLSTDDWWENCKAWFGEKNLPSDLTNFPSWAPQNGIPKLQAKKVPLIFVGGDKDPWSPLGLPIPDGTPREDNGTWMVYDTDYGHYFRYPEGMHDVFWYTPAYARAVFDEMLKYVSPTN